jgi:hypothetical protein
MLPMRKGAAPGVGTCSQQFRQFREHGEFELVAAIIDQARQDIEYARKPAIKHNGNGHKSARVVYAQQAEAWMNEEATQTAGEWSFPWCCEVLGLNPMKVRTEMLMATKTIKHKGKEASRGRCRKQS